MALSKTALVAQIQEVMTEELGYDNVSKRVISDTLDGLAVIAEEQIAAGEDFTIPGVVKIAWSYVTPRKKGEMYKKGETYIGFGGIETVAEADSKPRKESVKLRASVLAAIKRLGPTKETAARFMSTKTGKAVKARKAG